MFLNEIRQSDPDQSPPLKVNNSDKKGLKGSLSNSRDAPRAGQSKRISRAIVFILRAKFALACNIKDTLESID